MVSNSFLWKGALFPRGMMAAAIFLAGTILLPPRTAAQAPPPRVAAPKAPKALAKPKLVVLLVVDQMRGDYVDKFLGQWTGGLKRLVEEGAWFRDAAYPYAATETCVGHATISTGAFPWKPVSATPRFRLEPFPQRTAWSPTHGGTAKSRKW